MSFYKIFFFSCSKLGANRFEGRSGPIFTPFSVCSVCVCVCEMEQCRVLKALVGGLSGDYSVGP